MRIKNVKSEKFKKINELNYLRVSNRQLQSLEFKLHLLPVR